MQFTTRQPEKDPEGTPPAGFRITCDSMKTWLAGQNDPLSPSNAAKKLAVSRVERVYDVDDAGMIEVLYLDTDKQPQTAMLRGRGAERTLVYTTGGW